MYISMKWVFCLIFLISSIGSLIFINTTTDPLFLTEGEDIILSNDLFFQSPRDAVYINEINIKSDKLTVNISYGGGCKDHNFSLIGSNEYLESYPVRTSLLLSHQSNNDTCTAFFTQMLVFNLRTLKNNFQEMYPEYKGVLQLYVLGGQEVFTLEYSI